MAVSGCAFGAQFVARTRYHLMLGATQFFSRALLRHKVPGARSRIAPGQAIFRVINAMLSFLPLMNHFS